MLSSNAKKRVPQMPDQPQPELRLTALTNLCKASADTLRLLVLRVLRKDSFGVSELCFIFDIRQPALSHHLKVLANAGLVAARREANTIFYRRAELGQLPDLEALQHSIFEAVDAIELPADIQDRLADLHQQREENSSNFFQLNADKFRQQQDLIASYTQYADVVAQVLVTLVYDRGAVLAKVLAHVQIPHGFQCISERGDCARPHRQQKSFHADWIMCAQP